MSSEVRRQELLALLAAAEEPVTGTRLSERLGVSRQVIVQDIAILRAAGEAIFSTPRGYLLSCPSASALSYLVACRHHPDEVADELLTMVELGAEIVDVMVEHPLYGELCGKLMLSTPEQVRAFVGSLETSGARLLSSLTGGVHLHTIRVPDAATYRTVRNALLSRGYLLEEN